MSEIKKFMPVMARHEGNWVGEYIHVDMSGLIIDQHKSELSCTFPDKGPFPYFQKNLYTWESGKTEEILFPGTFKDNKVWFDNDRIKGYVWELDQRSLMLTWVRKDIESSYLYEMIQLSENNNSRTRTWHWFKDDECFQRTLIKEKRRD
ncbi:DUF3598 domain-containing protein [Alphaproteobacteria bacterium]|nr:DUF3598 domain-containing protein [Alphaproteobacteria bacterium]